MIERLRFVAAKVAVKMDLIAGTDEFPGHDQHVTLRIADCSGGASGPRVKRVCDPENAEMQGGEISNTPRGMR